MKIVLLIFILIGVGCKTYTNKNQEQRLKNSANKASEAGNFTTAINFYDQLLKIDSSNGEYYFGRADCYGMLTKRDQAEKDYLKAIQLNYRKGSCYYNIGLLNTFLIDSIALFYFEKALEIYPDRRDIKQEYDECLNRLKSN